MAAVQYHLREQLSAEKLGHAADGEGTAGRGCELARPGIAVRIGAELDRRDEVQDARHAPRYEHRVEVPLLLQPGRQRVLAEVLGDKRETEDDREVANARRTTSRRDGFGNEELSNHIEGEVRGEWTGEEGR